jgi:hypothetical protein
MTGRKPNTLIAGSIQYQISQMSIGDVRWIETTLDKYGHVQREWNLAKTRRADALKDFVMCCSVWKANSMKIADDTVILVRIERVK